MKFGILHHLYLLKLIEILAKAEKINFVIRRREDNLFKMIFDSCLKENIFEKNSFLFIDDDKESSVVSNLFFDNYNPAHLFHSEKDILFKAHPRLKIINKVNETHLERKNNPFYSATIIVSNATIFSTLLKELKTTIWWNNQAYFLIDNTNTMDSCEVAEEFLKIAWSFRIISIIYLCRKFNNEMRLYTFNPFSSAAPNCWNRVISSTATEWSWTLFRLKVERNNSILKHDGRSCTKNLFFDKTQNLYGFNLKGVFRTDRMSVYDKTKIGFERCNSIAGILQIMCGALVRINASITVKEVVSFGGFINDSEEVYGVRKDLMSGTADMYMYPLFLRNHWKQQAHSFYSVELMILTLKEPTLYLEKLAMVFTAHVLFILLLTFLVFTVLFKVILKLSVSLASLEVMRAIVTHTILAEPQNLARKIVLLVCLGAIFVFSSFVQSCLTTINTINDHKATIDTSEDLIKSALPIYGTASRKELIFEEEIKNRFVSIPDGDCLDWLLKGKRVACISPRFDAELSTLKSELLHVSKLSLAETTTSFLFADESPLINRFHSILLVMNEGGVIKRVFDHILYRAQANQFKEENSIRALNVKELNAVFIILALSWILGFVILLFEMSSP